MCHRIGRSRKGCCRTSPSLDEPKEALSFIKKRRERGRESENDRKYFSRLSPKGVVGTVVDRKCAMHTKEKGGGRALQPLQ